MQEAPLTAAQLDALSALTTPTVSNAIETFKIRLRDEGYINNEMICRLPKPKPMIGYAVTMKMRTDGPPSKGMAYPNRTDWWDVVAALPSPKILVIQDTNKHTGLGSVAGEVHGAIFKALGCVGIVTNGAVRDLEALEAMNMHIYSSSLSPSHAYSHIVEVGGPVELFGHTITNGDLLHGDQHGIVNVPLSIAARIPQASLQILKHEQRIINFCSSLEFDIEKLRELVENFTSGNEG